MRRADAAVHRRARVRQRGAVREPLVPAQPGGRARVRGAPRPAAAHGGAVRAAGRARRGGAHVRHRLIDADEF